MPTDIIDYQAPGERTEQEHVANIDGWHGYAENLAGKREHVKYDDETPW